MPKKRANGESALYPIRGGKLWRGVIDLGYHPDGRRHQVSVTAAKKSDALAKLQDKRAEIAEHGAPLTKKAVRVRDFSLAWLEEVARPDTAPKTYADYKSLVNRWINPTLGARHVSALTEADVRTLRKAMVDADLRMSRVRQGMIVLSLICDRAVHLKHLRTNPVEQVKKPGSKDARKQAAATKAAGGSTGERGALSSEHIAAMLKTSAAMPGLGGARWWFRLLTGTRQGEILGARLSDLDLDAGLYEVNWQAQELRREHGCNDGPDGRTASPVCGYSRGASCPAARWIVPDGHTAERLHGAWHLVPPKGERNRVVPLVPQLTEVLRRHVDALAERGEQANPHGLLFPAPDGRIVTPEADNDGWRSLLLAAGVITTEQATAGKNPYTGHWTRHTTVTVLASMGVDFQTIGEIVGHSSAQVTAMYRHVQAEEKKKAMDALGGAWIKALAPAN